MIYSIEHITYKICAIVTMNTQDKESTNEAKLLCLSIYLYLYVYMAVPYVRQADVPIKWIAKAKRPRHTVDLHMSVFV